MVGVKRVNEGLHLGNVELLVFFNDVNGKIEAGFYVLNAVLHVARHRLNKVRLIFEGQVLSGVATENHQTVQRPGDLGLNTRLEC